MTSLRALLRTTAASGEGAEPDAASTARARGRHAAGSASCAVLVAGAHVTRETWHPDDTLGAGPFVVAVLWGVVAVLLDRLVLPTWRGSTSARRVLGVMSLVGLWTALHWLATGAGDAPGFAVGTSVAVLFAVTTAAAALAERRVQSSAALSLAVVAALVLVLAAGLWRVHSASVTTAVDATLSVSTDGRTVRSDFTTDSCAEPLRLEVVETPQEVRVRTLISIGRGFPTGCRGVEVPRHLEVTLNAPVGARVLVPG